MASLADLENSIDTLLNHPLGYGNYKLVKKVEDKAYEAYIFGLCLRAIRELGATPVLRGINRDPNPFVFRGGPGQIYSTARNYGYADFSLKKYAFEVHAGVEFKGSSGMLHELDVCIIRAEDARKCRSTKEDPSSASLVGAWECKFYSNQLQKVHGRAFVGLMDDMGSNFRLSGLCSNKGHPQLSEYFKVQRRPYPNFELTPLFPSNEDVFVNQLKAELKRMAGI